MGYIQGADRNQVVLLPETLDDYVGMENEVRVIDAFIDRLDIKTMGFKAEAAREGRPGYDPRDMLKLYMYGYSNHIRSSRRLQKEAARNVEVMWLLKKIVPDFRCIADFRKDNAKAIKEVFRAFVKLCNGAGLLSHESVVIDGSKFRAVNADNPSFNVQTAVESENHLIVHYDVTDECVDWNLLKAGIDASKDALDVENIEGIADRGYSNSDEILDCLLAGDTPTTHPNKGEKNRIFRFNKITDEITEEMKKSTDPEVLKKCISAGVLPDVLQREDIELETFKRRETGTSVYINKETGELVSYSEMKAAGGLATEQVDVQREEPVQKYFERDIENDTVTCPMGQTLFYAGPGQPNGTKDESIRRYHRLSACLKCPNKCTLKKRRIVSFKEGETRKEVTFYDKAKEGKIVRKTNHQFKPLQLTEKESQWAEWVILRYYPNQKHLRKRNTIVEHPYGTVKRWHGAGYLLTKGKVKVAAEMGLSFLAYNFRRVINLLGIEGTMNMVKA